MQSIYTDNTNRNRMEISPINWTFQLCRPAAIERKKTNRIYCFPFLDVELGERGKSLMNIVDFFIYVSICQVTSPRDDIECVCLSCQSSQTDTAVVTKLQERLRTVRVPTAVFVVVEKGWLKREYKKLLYCFCFLYRICRFAERASQ